jgi:citronellol/citronellal dehydrogenase
MEASMARLLEGKVAIITGAGGGIGREHALTFAREGAKVVVNDLGSDRHGGGKGAEMADQTVADIKAAGGEATANYDSVTTREGADGIVWTALNKYGRIDVLVNNAGGQYMVPAEDITPKGFRTVMRLNVEGTWLMTHAVATRAMIPAGGGKVVNVTLSPHQGLPGMAHSSAARAGVENLTRALSIEWARFGVLLTAVAAGHFATDALEKYPEPVRQGVAGTVPLGRLGRPEELAWLVAYLASPAGDYLTGTTITVDGARDNWLGPWPPPGLADEEGRPLPEKRRPAGRDG